MKLSPDQIVYYEWRGFEILNATIVFTWVIMIVLVVASWLITKKITSGSKMSRWQNVLE
ncbi:MAG TPA: F0F1 ATP synthase subunit A, partial [Peptococcaceae bacterium]|nr:F0F1 ATP synthase subunit A [Peptococcaceae bacterium]